MNNETLIIGDLHIGNNKNNKLFYKITLDYAQWIKSICHERNITRIIQMGDIFHDRTAINLQSLQYAYEFFKILEKFEIHITAGNHDLFHNNDCSISSICILDRWPNISVYTKPTIVDDFVFLPWSTTLEDMPSGKIGIGHLELAGYEMSKGKICEHGLRGSDIMQKYELLLSGHFHKHQERKYNNKKFIYTGSAFQLSFGESGNSNFVFILNSETLAIEKIENTISPKFEYINSEDDYSKIPNNFVKINITNKNDIDNILTKIQSLNPLDIKTEFNTLDITTTDDQEKINEFKIVQIPDVLDEFVASMINLTPAQQKEVADELKVLYSSLT